MKKLAIYGAGGFGKEVRGMIELSPSGYSFAGYFDDFKKISPAVESDRYDDVLIAIADPLIRQKIAEQWSLKSVPFDPWISADINLHTSVEVNNGTIICPGVRMTVDISLGRFVIVNLGATIGHDVVIGDYSSIMPSVNISGSVTLGQRVFVGSGATILQGLSIGNDAVVGAGAVVTKDVAPGTVVAGVPAKPLNK